MKNPTVFILQVLMALSFLLAVTAWTTVVGRAALVTPAQVLSVIQK